MKPAMPFKATYLLVIPAVVIIGVGAFITIKDATPSYGATITVEPQTFTQDIAVQGEVQAAQNVELGFDQGGVVSAVYVHVGQTIAMGTPLAAIDNGNQEAAVAQQQAALQAAQATLASLQSGTRPQTIAITQTQIQNDQTAVTQAEQAVINAIRNAYTESDDAVHNKADELFSDPLSTTPTLDFTTTDSQLQPTLISERVAIEPVLDAWRADAALLMPASTDLAAAESQSQTDLALVSQLLSDANAALDAVAPSTQTPQTTLSGYVTAIGAARANVNAAQSTLTAAVTALQAAQAALSDDQGNLTLQQAGSTQDDIAAQQAVVAEAQANVQSAQAALAQTIVTAPFDGTVTQMDAKAGAVVSAADQDISLISNGLFQIVAYVPEVEIAGLAVGDEATTTLDAYGPDVYFPATVIAVDPAETIQDGVPTYKTTLQFTAQDPRIRSGMTANLDITIAIAPDALVVPLGAVFEDAAGQQTVQVVRDGTVLDVPVTVSSHYAVGNVQVNAGLEPGDTVILSPNTTN